MNLSLLQIVPFREEEHSGLLEPLTQMLHAAYKPLAEKGLRYSATHQPPEKTLKRLKQGEGFIAFWENRLIGTITLFKGRPDNPCEYYRREGVFHFGQYAVDPAFQGRGIGRRLLEFIEERAEALGGREMALDTAESAFELIATYERHGYKTVSHTKWAVTNYLSVVMSKSLT